METPALDPTTIAELLDVGDEEFVADLLRTFLEQATEIFIALQEALGTGDARAFGRAAHALAGSSMNVGALHLAEIARAAELAMKEEHAMPAAEQFREMRDELARVEAACASLECAAA